MSPNYSADLCALTDYETETQSPLLDIKEVLQIRQSFEEKDFMVCVPWKLSGSRDHWTLGFIDRYIEIVKGLMHMHIKGADPNLNNWMVWYHENLVHYIVA